MSALKAELISKAIKEFWFKGFNFSEPVDRDKVKKYFTSDDAFDAEIKAEFGEILHEALFSPTEPEWLTAMKSNKDGLLASIILLDQFPRNVYRDTANFVAGDSKSLSFSDTMIANGWDKQCHMLEKLFIYLPYEHSELRENSEKSIQLFTALLKDPQLKTEDMSMAMRFLDVAERHKVLIDRFGRYPYRNSVVGRTSTPKEIEYMENDGENFMPTKK